MKYKTPEQNLSKTGSHIFNYNFVKNALRLISMAQYFTEI